MSHVSSNNPQGLEATAAVPSPRPNAVARPGWPEIIAGLIAFGAVASGGGLLAGQLVSILSSTAWPSPHCLLSSLCWVCGSRMIDPPGAGLDMTFGNANGQPTLTLAGFGLGHTPSPALRRVDGSRLYDDFVAGMEQASREFARSRPPVALIGVGTIVEQGMLIEAEATAVIDRTDSSRTPTEVPR